MRARARAVSATALFLSMASACGAAAATAYLVHTPAEYATAAAALRPGDVVTLADGEWADFQVLFKGEGTAAAPITLTAQTPGQVVLTGQSNLRLAGRHLTVSNLVFRDGWSPTDSVVSFRESSKARATDSRVTGVVIDGFSKPDRTQSDNWVQLYGQDNRFDHNQIAGKSNAGPTVVVVRDATQGLDNRHQIDHNWFGRGPTWAPTAARPCASAPAPTRCPTRTPPSTTTGSRNATARWRSSPTSPAPTSTAATCSTGRAARWCCGTAAATWWRPTCSSATARATPAGCA